MPVTEPIDFFKEKRNVAAIKQEIFGKYFESWCTARLATWNATDGEAMLYLDLLAATGEEVEEPTSPPANLHEQFYKIFLKNPSINKSVQCFFYDKSKAVLERVKESIEALPFFEDLLHPPVSLSNSENKAQLETNLAAGCPSLVFLDPFRSGYGQELLLQTIHTWRSDLFMLLHPDYISRAVAGRKVSQPLVKLFGERLQIISNYCRKEKDNPKRQEFILNQLIRVLQEKGQFTLLFKVNQPEVEQPYHYLLFSSPDTHAYRIFKETILSYSTFQQDGVPLYTANEFLQPQFSLFEQRPVYTLPNLVERLTNQAAQYKYKSIEKIYEMDNCGTSYTRENYLAAYEQLRKEGKIELLNAKTMQTIRQPTPASVVKYRL